MCFALRLSSKIFLIRHGHESQWPGRLVRVRGFAAFKKQLITASNKTFMAGIHSTFILGRRPECGILAVFCALRCLALLLPRMGDSSKALQAACCDSLFRLMKQICDLCQANNEFRQVLVYHFLGKRPKSQIHSLNLQRTSAQSRCFVEENGS